MQPKVKNLEELKALVDRLKRERRVVVMANGCFDLLHVGHVRYLQEAKRLGDVLVVAVNSDSSARQLKGPTRPIVPEAERVEMLAAIEAVDYVVLFAESTVTRVLLELKPDIHAKGTDYTEETVPEVQIVRSYGGRVAITGDPKNHAATDLIKYIAGLPHESAS